MGLFFGESREEKQERKEMEMNEYIEGIGLEGLDSKDINRIKEVLCLKGKYIYGITSSRISSASLEALEALVEQNWLILKKLDSIDKNLKELNNK